jgi:lipoprotein-anchoring transpeptidase ErfK/SrfK
VLQSGRDGTELADKNVLADAIAQSLKAKQDSAQTMNIKVAAYQTVNMNAYDKWIEVDLSEQRTTAYEKATPIKNFLIASGMRGHETPVGEYAIWLRVRSQTMQGGSKADGSYYNIPNVEWVSYFYQDYALHGAWWREKFGAPASHGCVNMTNADAQWIFEWAPVGTKVIVHA